MRRLILSVCAVMAFSAAPMSGAMSTEPKYIRYGKDVPAVPVAEWDAGSKVMQVTGKDQIGVAPKNAVVYTVKTVQWPTATVRVYEFTKAAGGVLHTINDETAIYVAKGSVKATVGDKTVVLKKGDVVSRASGVLRSGDVVEDTSLVSWNSGAVSTEPAIPTVVHPDQTINMGSAETTVIRRYAFPGNSVRYAEMGPNVKQPPNTGPADNLMYFFEGHVQYTQGGETYEVHGGDFLRQESGTLHNWDQKEGAKFVASSALPIGKDKPMNPDEAFSSYTRHETEQKK